MGVENIRKREQERMEGLIISIIDLTFFFLQENRPNLFMGAICN